MSKGLYKPLKEKVGAESKDFLQIGKEKKYIRISQDQKRVTYTAVDKNYNFNDPEEKIRAAFYVEFIEKYKYHPKRIKMEVVVPRRKPEDKADIVIYEDDELKTPYIVIECKKDGISDAEFKQAIEQVFGNANSLRAKFAAVVAGHTRTVIFPRKSGHNEELVVV